LYYGRFIVRINAFLRVSYRARPHTRAIKLDGNDVRILSVIALFSFEKPHHVIEACLVLLHEPKECAIFRDILRRRGTVTIRNRIYDISSKVLMKYRKFDFDRNSTA